jgi:hypothetical protein
MPLSIFRFIIPTIPMLAFLILWQFTAGGSARTRPNNPLHAHHITHAFFYVSYLKTYGTFNPTYDHADSTPHSRR